MTIRAGAAPRPVRVRVPAKINLHLGVGPLRPDGYHELNTVYHAISLYDELTARRGDTLTLTMEGEGAGELALDESNLVIRAARALAAYAGVPAHARLHLRKQIPLAGGLAGGSADAAATLVACDALWGTGLGPRRTRRHRRRTRLGRAVPGARRHRARHRPRRGGQPGAGPADLLALGGRRSPTAASPPRRRTASSTGCGRPAPPPTPLAGTDALLAALRQRDPAVLAAALGNDLQAAALSHAPGAGRDPQGRRAAQARSPASSPAPGRPASSSPPTRTPPRRSPRHWTRRSAGWCTPRTARCRAHGSSDPPHRVGLSGRPRVCRPAATVGALTCGR